MKLYYYYFSPDLDHMDLTECKTTLCIINEKHNLIHGLKIEGKQRLALVIKILKGSKKYALLNLKHEDEAIMKLAQLRIKNEDKIYNAYDYFHTIKHVPTHMVNLL